MKILRFGSLIAAFSIVLVSSDASFGEKKTGSKPITTKFDKNLLPPGSSSSELQSKRNSAKSGNQSSVKKR